MVSDKFFIAGLALYCFAQVASADDTWLTNQLSTCMNKSGGVTAEMLNCISEESKLQDTRLNKAYKEVMAQLSPSCKKQLQDAQRAWFRQRRIVADVEFDAECGLWTVACPRLGVYTEARTYEELLSRFWSLSGDMATENHLALPHDSRIEFRHISPLANKILHDAGIRARL